MLYCPGRIYFARAPNTLKVENNGRVAFIGIVIHDYFVLPMSLFIDFDVSLPKPESFFRTIFGSAAFAVTKR